MFRAAWFAILSALAVYAQQAQQQPRFEVASIKPGGDIFSTKPQRSPGRLTWTTQLAYLIGYAYGLDSARVSGQGLGDIYTINAVFEPKMTDGELRLMLQGLLADRFDMRFHRAVKEVDGYGISIGRGGNKMKEAVSGSSPVDESYLSATGPLPGVISITGRGASISQLTGTLGRIVGTPLWDQTGLEGKYDFAFRFSEDPGADSLTDTPSLSTALRESLGLTMRKQRGPLETLVIDHLAPPSAN
jgi:uncharacterized protein (TIGR03435 family)